MNVNSLITKDYRKKDDFAVQKNKPNSNPNKADLKRAKMNISIATIKDYDNEQRTINNERYSKQTQSKPVLSAVEWANFKRGLAKMGHHE